MSKSTFHTVATLIFAAFMVSNAQAQYAVNRYVFGNGGSETRNTQNHIIGTLGQPIIGVMTSQNNRAELGFWYNVDGAPVGIENERSLPAFMDLGENFPNPVNGSSIIPFTINRKCVAHLDIVNILGVPVQNLLHEEMAPGSYQVTFHAASLKPGIYFYRLESDNFSLTKSIVIQK